jgi:hypothetical protein
MEAKLKGGKIRGKKALLKNAFSEVVSKYMCHFMAADMKAYHIEEDWSFIFLKTKFSSRINRILAGTG